MKCAIVDERISSACEKGLLLRGFRVIRLPRSARLGDAVSAHPDMLLFYHNNRIISSADYCESYPWVFSDIRELCPNIEFNFTSDVFGKQYPRDALFNALTVGEYIFLKKDSVSPRIINYADRMRLKTVFVNQGYPACTTLAFGGSAITADKGMEKALSSVGINVTLIANGDILLPPYQYGFIGGAAGVNDRCVYFLGNISTHRDFHKINKALEYEGYTPVSLSDEPLRDLGRIIFID